MSLQPKSLNTDSLEAEADDASIDQTRVAGKTRRLCQWLSESSSELDRGGAWPEAQIEQLTQADVFRWFVPKHFGGLEYSEVELLNGYLALSQSCLTTTFILTQWNAACKRIQGSPNSELKARLLPKLASGELFATVGISHLTTSRQHVSRPVLIAKPLEDEGFQLDGFSPWVTAARAADVLVVGATLPQTTGATGSVPKQVMLAVPSSTPGVTAHPGSPLVALSASCTDRVDFDSVRVAAENVVAGPIENVLATNSGGGAGGLQTSTLAIGLSMAAAGFLQSQAMQRADLTEIANKITADCQALEANLRQLSVNEPCSLNASELRQKANSLVLRSTQAALSAAKGAGFVATHPVGRWAREALFFLVWSCPQPVVAANLCELAQLEFDA